MKKSLFALLLVISSTLLAQEHNPRLAEVNRHMGLLVFVDSHPVCEYETLGIIKGSSWNMSSGQYEPIRNSLLSKIKKEYPQADGAILYFVDGGTDQAEAIKFKPVASKMPKNESIEFSKQLINR